MGTGSDKSTLKSHLAAEGGEARCSVKNLCELK